MNRKDEVFARDAALPWEDVGIGVKRKVLAYSDAIMMVRVAFEAGGIGTPHSHPHLQCSLIESGVFDVTVAGETQRLVAGDSFNVPADSVHGVVAVEAGILLDVFTPMRADFVA